ncbi:aldose epimerase family protein [Lacticaseibacillus sp. GG6-2]
MSVESKLFARIQGEPITQYSLVNSNQMAVRLITFGARVQQLRLPNADAFDPNLIVGFVTIQDYLNQPEPYGALLGPDYANHERADWQNWNWDATVGDNAVTMTLTLPEAADGRPGTQQVTITHTLDDDNCWQQHLLIQSDTPMAIRPAQNLAYMLTGDPARTIDHQKLTIDGVTASPQPQTTTTTQARLEDEDWQLTLSTDAAGLTVSTYDHIDTTTNFNGIQGHPHAAVGLRPLVTADDQSIQIDSEHPYEQTTTVILQSGEARS